MIMDVPNPDVNFSVIVVLGRIDFFGKNLNSRSFPEPTYKVILSSKILTKQKRRNVFLILRVKPSEY